MLQLASPLVLFLLPLPVLVYWLMKPHEESRTALHVPFLARLAILTGQKPGTGSVILSRSLLQKLLLGIVWCSLLVALARPQIIGEPIIKENPARDMLIAVDLSGSMETTDFTSTKGEKISRMDAVKEVLDEFLENRSGDRVGLIFFGNAPFLQVPFTEDLNVCRSLLKEAQPRMAGPKTMIGDAIGKAVTIFDRSDLKEKVLILLTDGNDTGSLVSPAKAAQIAHDKEVQIHVIGMGDPTTVGEEKLDLDTLDQIAKATGGQRFLAIDNNELKKVYQEIDNLTTRKVETLSYRPVYELYFWPLLFGIGLSLLFHGWYSLKHFMTPIKSQPSQLMTLSFAILAVTGWGMVQWSHYRIGRLHFLRGELLWALIPSCIFIYLMIRERDDRLSWQKIIEPHLLNVLLLKDDQYRRIKPIHLLSILWILGIVSVSGPAWRYEDSPFAEEQSALVIALKVTPSMMTEDVQPNRLERSVHKIHDLLEKRKGAHTSLIAYAGSAHVVMPLTFDSSVIESFAAELKPEIMPKEGEDSSAAYLLAQKQLTDADKSGSILFILDGMSPSETESLQKSRQSGSPSPVFWGMLDISVPTQEQDSLKQSAGSINAPLVYVSPDNRDVDSVTRQLERHLSQVTDNDQQKQWRDEGYRLIPFLCLVSLMWFRPGWVIPRE